jgi:hypothetical protein
MSKRATRSAASTSKSASFVPASLLVPASFVPEESEEEKMESGDDSNDPPYK